MSDLLVEGQQPIMPLPEREPAALRAAVARLDPVALVRFEADWTAATARARDEYSLFPARYFVEHWFSWVAVERWPQMAARLRACERIVAGSRGASGGCGRDQPDLAAGRDTYCVSDWTWEYVPDAANVMGG